MIPPTAFRAVGYTGKAWNYPLTPRAQRIIAQHNGVTVEQMPETFRYAPNASMQLWMDMLGAAQDAGLPHRDPDGRWFTMKRLMA